MSYCTYLEQRKKKEIINLLMIVDVMGKFYICYIYFFFILDAKKKIYIYIF